MARINRTDIIQKAVNDLALSTSGTIIPNETLDKVQLVYSLNSQYSNFISNGNQTTTGTMSTAVPIVGNGQRVFVTSIDVHMIKDATCDAATGAITIGMTPNNIGISKNIAQVGIIALTAQSEHININLPFPIEVKSAGTITLSGTFTAGVMVRTISVAGFTTSSN